MRERRFLAALGEWRSKDGCRWQDATPSFQLQAYKDGRLVLDVDCGKTAKLYDWASLTKIVFSTTSAMLEIENGGLGLNDRIIDWLPELAMDLKDRKALAVLDSIRVRDLLSHSAGMTWWKPFYKLVAARKPKSHEEAWSRLFGLVVKDVRERASNGELARAKRGPAIYSDLDFFLLAEILRRATLSGFSRRWDEISDRLGLRSTYFHALVRADVGMGAVAKSKRASLCAPTENDPWRGRVLKGEVHDENTASLLGIAPHAGLFGPIDDLSTYGLELRNLALRKKSALPVAGRKFLNRSVSRDRGDWGLGFMMPTLGRASCGPLFSGQSIGHTGFTGTSLWFDPKRDLLITILSNRVHPTRKSSLFVELRPALHTLAVKSL